MSKLCSAISNFLQSGSKINGLYFMYEKNIHNKKDINE